MKKKLFFLISILIFLVLFLFLVFIKLGIFLDVLEKNKKSDIIFCLGGESLNRIKHAINLYNLGYSKKKILILTGNENNKNNKIDVRVTKIINSNYKINYRLIKNTKNTEDEIIFIKKFMQNNNYKSAIIVSDPPHSKRIKILINYIIKDKNLSFNIVKINNSWWDRMYFYKNKRSLKFAINELFKIIYTHVKYGFFYKIGLEKFINSVNEPYLYPIKKELNKQLSKYID